MRSRGFTLLEVVLAIGLTGAVLVLLTTAIDLYLMRVDSSRTRVESAQLARTLLTMIADDLRAVRYVDTSAESSGEDASDSGGTTTGSDVAAAASVRGIYGTSIELRIDRGAVGRWERITREVDPSEATTTAQMPQTIRYFVSEGDDLPTEELAAAGVTDEPLGTGYSGLFRQKSATIRSLSQSSSSVVALTPTDDQTEELLAPEVLEVEFAYFDGEALLPEWDSALQEGLPTAVEIRLSVLEEPFELADERRASERDVVRRSAGDAVEYRLLVRITPVSEPTNAESPRIEDRQEGNQFGNNNGSN